VVAAVSNTLGSSAQRAAGRKAKDSRTRPASLACVDGDGDGDGDGEW
jgi:hypothetical protein